MTDNAFGGRVHFEIATASLYTDMQQEAFLKRVKQDLPDLTEKEIKEVEQFAFWYSLTENITFKFDGREKRALKKFKADWKRRDDMSSRELLDFWLKLPFEIRTAWILEASAEQELFEVTPEQLPTNKLSDKQKEELADPDSPLV